LGVAGFRSEAVIVICKRDKGAILTSSLGRVKQIERIIAE
jgi:hypothetical protein